MEKRQPSCTLVGMYTGAATMKNNVESPQKIGVELPYDLTILLMGIYPKKTKNTNLKRYTHTHTHTHTRPYTHSKSQDKETA